MSSLHAMGLAPETSSSPCPSAVGGGPLEGSSGLTLASVRGKQSSWSPRVSEVEMGLGLQFPGHPGGWPSLCSPLRGWSLADTVLLASWALPAEDWKAGPCERLGAPGLLGSLNFASVLCDSAVSLPVTYGEKESRDAGHICVLRAALLGCIWQLEASVAA